MAAVVGALRADLSANVGGFAADMAKAETPVEKFASKVRNVGLGLTAGGAALTAGITMPLIAFAHASTAAWEESEQGASQTEAALKSMGNNSGRSLDDLTKAAQRFQDTLAVDGDEVLQKVTANMLTFGNISGKAFDQAQLAAINLSRRMGMDLQSATLLVGKALNDPIAGMKALRRVGIQLTDQEVDQIKTMTKAGDVAGAQGVILGELQKQFGGAAAAYAQTSAGIRESNRLAFGDVQETVGKVIDQWEGPLLKTINDVLKGFLALPEPVQGTIIGVAALLAVVGPLTTAIGGLVTAVSFVEPAMAAVAAVVEGPMIAGFVALLPELLPIIAVVAALVAAFLLFKDKIMPVLTELWGEATKTLGPPLQDLLNSVVEALKPIWEAFQQIWAVVGPILGELASAFIKTFGETIIVQVKAALIVLKAVFDNIGLMLKFVGQLLTGDFSGAWDTACKMAANAVNMLLGVIDTIFPGIIKSVSDLYNGVKTWLQDKLGAVFKWVGDKVQALGDGFKKLYDDVVGHSYVPDMVDEIGAQFGRLDGVMVKPAQAAISTVSDSFKSMSDQVGQGLAQMLIDGKVSLSGLRDLANQTAQSLFVNPFKQQLGQGLSGLISNVFGGLFGGGKAGGGPVTAGHGYIVGENGPEWFQPNTGGNIVPNGMGQGQSITMNVYTNDATSFTRSQRQVSRAAKAALA